MVKDLVYEEPFGFRVVHHMLLAILFYELYIFSFYNLTLKTMRNKTINKEIKEKLVYWFGFQIYDLQLTSNKIISLSVDEI